MSAMIDDAHDPSAPRGEENYRLLFDYAPLGYQSLDVSGRLLDVNRTWTELLGYAREEVIGRLFREFIVEPATEELEPRFEAFLRSGSVRDVQFKLRRADGRDLDVLFDGRVVRDPDGGGLRTHCVFRDITEFHRTRRALIESENRLRALSDASFESIFLSENGICLDQNATAERMFRLHPRRGDRASRHRLDRLRGSRHGEPPDAGRDRDALRGHRPCARTAPPSPPNSRGACSTTGDGGSG